MISSSVVGVIAQRLVRVFCKECEGKGCKGCLDTGYKGRRGIYELMIPDEQIRKLIADKAALDEIRQAVLKTGMKTMRDDGLEKVGKGLTSREEVLRVTQEE